MVRVIGHCWKEVIKYCIKLAFVYCSGHAYSRLCRREHAMRRRAVYPCAGWVLRAYKNVCSGCELSFSKKIVAVEMLSDVAVLDGLLCSCFFSCSCCSSEWYVSSPVLSSQFSVVRLFPGLCSLASAVYS